MRLGTSHSISFVPALYRADTAEKTVMREVKESISALADSPFLVCAVNVE